MIFSQSTLLKEFHNITHAFTTQKSGNLAYHVNDDALHVERNHLNLSKELNFNRRTLVHMKQIHSDIVHIVRDEDNFDKPPTCDALITNKLDTPLMVMVADCSPILFYDDRQKVIAVAHAGRAGAFKNIIKNVIDSMKENFNSSASSLHVAIGASIGACCYDVGQEIYDEAQDLKLEYAFEINDNKYYLNIKEILKKQLLACGAKSENIEISEECTCCLKYKYFSYRADKRCGREAGVIKLNS